MEANQGDNSEEEEIREPQVTSSDPNERKLARKLRIERRLEAIRRQNLPEGEEEEEEVEKTLLQKQLLTSAEILERLVIEGNEYVSNVRVANDVREFDRREEEGIGREKIIEQLEEEANSAQEMFNEITEKWQKILSYNDPLHINDDMLNQKEKCDDLISQKDEVILMLKGEIKMSDIKFGKDQRKQNEDINTLAHRIEKQVILMRRAYRQELQLIEEVVMIERKMLIDANDKRWEELYKRRDEEEETNSDKKFEQLEEFEEEMRILRVQHEERFREIKIKLENDIENLQTELEQIKALALSNTEKLDYNYQILKKREDENIIIKSQQKRRMNKLQDIINDLRSKIRNFDSSSNSQIEKLSMEVNELRHNVLDIEEKADHFAKINDVKYKQMWNMNEKRAEKRLKSILSTDRLLHEQQLGIPWLPPEDTLLQRTDLPSYKSALLVVPEIFNIMATKTTMTISKSMSSPVDKPEAVTASHRRLLKHILTHIADKSGFLLEERLQIILKPFTKNEKTLVRVDNVFDALHLTKKEDIDILIQFFLPYSKCPLCAAKISSKTNSQESVIGIHDMESASTEESERSDSIIITDMAEVLAAVQQPNDVIDNILQTSFEERRFSSTSLPKVISKMPESSVISVKTLEGPTTSKLSKYPETLKLFCENSHPLVISSVYALRALREFVSKYHVSKEGVITMTSRLSQKRSTVSRLMVGEDVKMYWERFRAIFSPSREQLWDGLLFGLKKYHEILKDRQQLSDEVISLRRQNKELTNLLRNYMDKAKKMRPPCAKQREVPLRSSPIETHCRKL